MSTAVTHPQDHAHGHGDDHAHDHPHGWRRWLFATNHKDIGTLYLLFSFMMLLSGGTLALLIRLELFQPGLQFVDPQFFNSMTTEHALVMIFGDVMPAWVGIANWMIPLQVGAPDMALPRMNNFSFWLLPFAFILLLGTFLVPGGSPAGGSSPPRSNLVWIARAASATSAWRTTAVMRISEVVIISMLMPASRRASQKSAVTPGWDFMPAPTRETLPIWSS